MKYFPLIELVKEAPNPSLSPAAPSPISIRMISAGEVKRKC